MNEIFKTAKTTLISTLVSASFTAIIVLVAMYFTQLSQSSRISALEENSVRKDVLTETLEPMKSDIRDIKVDIKVLLAK